jgi:hypothetical protein
MRRGGVVRGYFLKTHIVVKCVCLCGSGDNDHTPVVNNPWQMTIGDLKSKVSAI